VRVYFVTVKERVYQALKVIPDSTSVLCRKEGWEEAHSTRL